MPEPDVFTDAVAPDRSLQPYLRSNIRSSLFQISNTLLPFFGLWYLMYLSLDYSYWLTMALALPTTGLLMRLFIIQHDCGHGSFFPKQKMNNALGFVLGVITVTPYDYWRRTHAIHHATSGNLDHRDFGDITTLTVKEYKGLTPMRRLAYRVYRHPLVLFGIGPAYMFILKQRFPWDLPIAWRKEWRSVMLTNLAMAAITVIMWKTIGLTAFLKIQLPMTLLSGSIGVWLFYIQHQFQETYWDRDGAWDYHDASIRGSSYYDLPAIVNWFTGHIGIHHVHHLCSRIPNYRLKECLRENSYLQQATRLTIKESFSCIRLKLWDEESRQLVGFDDVHKPTAPVRKRESKIAA